MGVKLSRSTHPSGMTALYKATNQVNGDFYIGVTSQKLSARKNHHLFYAKSGSKNFFHRAINKYGKDNFIFENLWFCQNKSEALQEEIRLIRVMQPKYNITKGGEGCYLRGESPLKGKRRPPELVARVAEKIRGKKFILTDEQRSFRRIQAENMRICKKSLNRPNSEKQRDSVRRMGLKRAKKVLCISDGKIFRSTREAALNYKINYRQIWAVCAKKRDTAHKLKFKYAGDL